MWAGRRGLRLPLVAIHFALLLPLLLLHALLPAVPVAAQPCATFGGSGSWAEDRSAADGNPLRGFFSYANSAPDAFPKSLEFQYVSMRSLSTGLNSFDWSALDSLLADVSSRNRQVVFRVYLDYPDNPPSGVPQWLISGGLTMTPYSNQGTGESPDYTDSTLRQAMANLIAAMGARYDGDQRIGFIMVGFLGYWGEWHMYPNDSQMAPANVRAEIISAFSSAFTTTRCVVSADELMYSGDAGDPDVAATAIGWHDDDFGASTCTQTWGFEARLGNQGAAGHVSEAPFGGEVQPSIQGSVFSSQGNADVLRACILSTKPSWLLNYGLFNSLSQTERDRAVVVNRELGYNFVVSQVQAEPEPGSSCDIYSSNARGDSCAKLSISVENTGPAPFYYDAAFKAQISGALSGGTNFVSADSTGSQALKGLLSSQGTVLHTVLISWDASEVSGTVPVTVKIDSAAILAGQTIKLGQTGTESDGSLLVSVPATCTGSTGSGSGSTTTTTTSTSATGTTTTTTTSTSTTGTTGCVPQTCAAFPGRCGTFSDGCGGITALCTCPSLNDVCLANSTCRACSPATCSDLGATCGQHDDTCGGVVTCGPCNGGEFCFNNRTCQTLGCTPSQSCAPGSCGTLFQVPCVENALQTTDVSCGGCTGVGESCSAQNMQTQVGTCSCPPAICPATQTCGSIPDGCGNVVSCGTCSLNSPCQFSTLTCAAINCGPNQVLQAGACKCEAGFVEDPVTFECARPKVEAETTEATATDTGLIVGVIVGAVVCLLLGVAAVVVFVRRNGRSKWAS